MRRCKHPNAVISEEFVTYTIHSFEGGNYTDSDSDPNVGEYNGTVFVDCKDCGWESKKFTPENRPAWLQSLLNKAQGVE